MSKFVRAILVSVICALSFVLIVSYANPDLYQGMIKAMTPTQSGTRTSVKSAPVIPEAFGGNLTMDAMKTEFLKLNRTLPKKLSKMSASDTKRIEIYNSLKNVNFGRKDGELLRRQTALINSLEGENIPTDLQGLMNSGTSTNMSQKIKEYTDALPWDTETLNAAPQNFIFTYKYPVEYVKVNADTIDFAKPSTYKWSSLFGACAVGNQALTVNSASFQGNGKPGFSTKIQGYYLVWDNTTNAYKAYTFWPSSIDTGSGWTGDIVLPKPVVLDPSGKQQCTVFGIAYQQITKPSAGLGYEQFDLKGLRNQTSGDLTVLKTVQNNSFPNGVLKKIGDFEALNGVLNIFNLKEQIMLGQISYVQSPLNHSVGSTNASMGYVYLNTPTDAYDNLNTVVVNMESSYDSSVKIEGKLRVEVTRDSKFYDDTVTTSYNFPVTLKKGSNTIPVNLSLKPASNITFCFYANQLPDTAGKLKLTITDLGTSGGKFNNYGFCTSASVTGCTTPLSARDLVVVNVIDPQGGDSYLNAEYWPEVDGTSYLWFDKDDSEIIPPTEYVANLELHVVGATPPIDVGPIDLKVLGNFTQNLNLEVRVSANVAGDSWYSDVKNFSVLPNQTITINKIPSADGEVLIYIYPKNLPNDSVLNPKYVKFLIEGIPATYSLDGVNVLKGDNTVVKVVDGGSFPIVTSNMNFGEDSIFVGGGINSLAPRQQIDLSKPNSGEFAVSDTCLTARGDVNLYSFTYNHWNTFYPPFQDIILKTSANKIYYNNGILGGGTIVKWTNDTLTFNLTNPELLIHGHKSCLNLLVLPPTESVSGAYFNLAEVVAKDDHGKQVKVYTQTVPSVIELKDDPVEGTVSDFNCSAFDANGKCLY